MEDELLIEQVASGDSMAFGELDARWRSKITAYLARKIGGNVADSEELAQEVMVKVWAKSATFCRSNGTFAVWIKRLACNVLVDTVRHRQRVKRGGNAVHCEYVDSVQPEGNRVITESDIQQLHKAIAQLPAKQRRQCRAFLREQSAQEISNTMACGRTTVSTHRAQAFESLREMIKLQSDDSIRSVELPEAAPVQLTLFQLPAERGHNAKRNKVQKLQDAAAGKDKQKRLF